MSDDNNGNAAIVALLREVLGSSYTSLQVLKAVVEENLADDTTSITCEVTYEGEGADGERSVIAGKGVGVIDAFFHGMQSRFAEEYPSLKTIRFSNFSLDAELGAKKDFAGTDSPARVTIEITNSEGRTFSFHHTARSVIAAGIIATLRSMEYFINSERAFVTMHHALRYAQERRRSDLVQRYTDTMATLVRNTSYSEVISRIREKMGQ